MSVGRKLYNYIYNYRLHRWWIYILQVTIIREFNYMGQLLPCPVILGWLYERYEMQIQEIIQMRVNYELCDWNDNAM